MRYQSEYGHTLNQIISICDTIKRVPLFWGLIAYIGVLIVFDYL